MSSQPPRVPKYRRHSSGQARVTLDGKDHLLGPYGSAASREAYRRKVAEWLETRGKAQAGADAPPVSVNEVILSYWKHAAAYYGFTDDADRGDAYCLRDALRVLKELYGRTPARDFGPLALKACRSAMLAKDWSRTYANAQVDRIRRMFRWAAEEELLPGAVYQNLRSVSGLRRGKSAARETAKVRPAPAADVDAALPLLPPAVTAMVRLQLLTGCRPAEVCRLRPIDLDMTNPACWVYRPEKHKTEHHGHDRMVFVGPRAQEVLRPFLGTKVDAYCFCPSESELRRNAARREGRRTPLNPNRKARKPGPRRRRAPGDRYDTHGYRRAVARACRKAGVPAWSPQPAAAQPGDGTEALRPGPGEDHPRPRQGGDHANLRGEGLARCDGTGGANRLRRTIAKAGGRASYPAAARPRRRGFSLSPAAGRAIPKSEIPPCPKST